MEKEKIKKFLVQWDRNDYGYIEIEAETKEKAEELFMQGEFKNEDLFIKDGGFDIALPTEEIE